MIQWPSELVKDIARRRSVIVLGAGISAGCQNSVGRKPKTWSDFLKHAANSIHPNQHIMKLINRQDYLTACEVIKTKLGRGPFDTLAMDEFLTPGYINSKMHEEVFKLDSGIVASPNFDKIYETYANSQTNGTIRIKHQYDNDVAEAVRRNNRLVLKIHGTTDTPGQMIFTRKEYAEARQKYRSFYSVLEALALTHTFLFLGCGVNDPDIRLLLEDNYFRHPMGRPHIWVLPKGSIHGDVINVIETTMNLKVLLYSKSNNHKELLDSVEDMVIQVENVRDQLRKSSNW